MPSNTSAQARGLGKLAAPTATAVAPLANLVPDSLTHMRALNPWGVGHSMPEFAKEPFHTMWKKGKVK